MVGDICCDIVPAPYGLKLRYFILNYQTESSPASVSWGSGTAWRRKTLSVQEAQRRWAAQLTGRVEGGDGATWVFHESGPQHCFAF
uniref:Uncharacterized protein n=1 Tax=Knipowitschia caucasica TaxID=637954 RepID=A0AAV2KRM9_KNICA